MSQPTGPTLPDLQGLWRRDWLRSPGHEDTDTLVLWRQGPQVYVDLRIPHDAPHPSGCTALADLDGPDLRALCACEGFAGVASVDQGVCTWTRTINYRGPETGHDVGALSLTPEGLVETGVHADYAELWTHAEADHTRARVLRRADGQMCFIVWSTAAFSIGRGAPGALQGTALAHRVAEALDAQDRQALVTSFDQEFASGRFETDDAVILHSTNPSRIGAVAFRRSDLDAAAPRLTEIDFNGVTSSPLWTDATADQSDPQGVAKTFQSG